MNNPKRILFALSFILMAHAFSQSNYVGAYVLMNNNDTVNGYIQQDVEGNLLTEITFSKNQKGEQNIKYTSDQIKGFHFDNGNFFEAVTFKGIDTLQHTYFSKVLVSGYYKLYSFIQSDVKRYIIRHDDSSFFLYDDKILFDGTFDIKGNYLNQLFFLSRNCSNLNSTVQTLRYNDNVIMNFVSQLNTCVAPEKASNFLYIKPKSTQRFYVYTDGIILGGKYQVTGRAGMKLSTPSISKNTSLNVSIAYFVRKKTETEVISYFITRKYKIETDITSASATLQYNFTTGIIRPYIEAGLGVAYQKEEDPRVIGAPSGFQEKYGIDIIGAFGIEGNLTKNLVINANWRYELSLHYPAIGITYFIK